MDRAARLVEMARITHHDLRHLFATIGIESGVDVPTVASWLGHKDGGALAMKTYKHLRDEHSVSAAKKVSFVPVATTKQGDIIPFSATFNQIPQAPGKDCENGSTDKAAQIALSQESHEWLEPPVFRVSLASRASLALPESLVFPVSPASEGQAVEGDIEEELKRLAGCNACTARKGAKTRRFKLARELATIQMREGRKLAPSEVITACGEWFKLSRPFLELRRRSRSI